MRKQLLSMLFCTSVCMAQAQNLVPNPSFEAYTQCPSNWSQVDRCVGWSDCSQSPDYLNRCSQGDSVGVPRNSFGYQEPFDGDAYMGCGTYVEGSPNYREVIQCTLNAPLVPGNLYHLSMRVVAQGVGNFYTTRCRYASSGIGMKFSIGPRTVQTLWPGNVALFAQDVISDTLNWTIISGDLVADSAYTQLFIGCFIPDESLAIQVFDTAGTIAAAYVFVDAVCVQAGTTDCSFTTGVDERPRGTSAVRLAPSAELLNIYCAHPSASISSVALYDGAGRLCLTSQLPAGVVQHTLDIASLPPGIYLVRILSASNASWSGRFVHP